MRKRQHHRFTKRLEVKFSSGEQTFIGISSNLSESGLFIRTKRCFVIGSIIDIELVMPDGQLSHLKGRVARATKTSMASFKNGMGIELIEKDTAYLNYLKNFSEGTDTDAENNALPEFQIISCPSCGVKNKVSSTKLSYGPKCAKCGASLLLY